LDLLVTPRDDLKIVPLKRRLRRSRRTLSLVRNYDVFLDLIDKESLRARRVTRERFEFLSAVLKERRAYRMHRIRGYLQALDLTVISSRLGLTSWAESAAPDARTPGPIPINRASQLIDSTEEIEDVFQEARIALRAADRLEQRFSQFCVLASQAHETTIPADLHQLRIAAKRVRYLLEVISDMGYGDPPRPLAWLRSLQDRIGDWHDFEALEDEIIDLTARPRFLKQNLLDSVVMLQVAGHLQRKKAQLISRLFPIRVPKMLEAACGRLTRRLRKR